MSLTTETTPSHHDIYQGLLANAVRALTDAAHLPRRSLRRTADGRWIEDTNAAVDRTDWAEFVTCALAGAAANLGGIEAALAGRPGSWEAEGVRQLLHATVGDDHAQLWRHRTDSVEITLHVDELLVEHTDAHTAYDRAQTVIELRYRAIHDQWNSAIDARHLWTYQRAESGAMIPPRARRPGVVLGCLARGPAR